MSNYPTYVLPSLQKKYDKLYRNIRYNEDDVVNVLSMFNLNKDKLDNKELYFNDTIDMALLDYILKCILLDIKNGYNDNMKENAETISKMERSDLTKAFQFFIPKCKKYSLVDLVLLIVTFKPKKLSITEILDRIVECPENRVFSLDLMMYVNKKSPSRYTSTMPVISNVELVYEYIHNVLFGLDSTKINNRSNSLYLHIDTGKEISEVKTREYKLINKDFRLVSNDDIIMPYSVKLIIHYENKLSPSDFIDIAEAETTRPKRKAIPKAIRNQLWKKYFGESIKGTCYCCKSEIDALSHFEAGHIIAAAKGGSDNVDNLRPLCMPCNRSMGTMNMDDYMEKYMK